MIIIQAQTGCKKFVEIDTPPGSISQSNIFSNDRTAATVLTGLYGIMSNSGVGAHIAKYGGLLADEFSLWNDPDIANAAYYTNSHVSNLTRNTGNEVWNDYYNYIFSCNTAIEGLTISNLTPTVKKQLLGEAYFLRTWFYFYLVNLYGDLPLVVSTDPEVNRLLVRSSVPTVYQLMIDDLLKAQELLSEEYVNDKLLPYTTTDPERLRPTKWAAIALLARIYLYNGQYAKAETEASKLIANTTLFSLLPLGDIFLKNSHEAIWQLQPVQTGWNTWEARMFNLSSFPSGLSFDKPVYLSPFILNAFEPNDLRYNQWVESLVEGTTTYYFPVKYRLGEENGDVVSPDNLTEYSMMLRLGELYLIRAEARARQGNLGGAIEDLDNIRSRAGLPLIAATNQNITQDALLNTILHERQIELFTEWGHRWFDLKRTNNIGVIMSNVTPVKGGTWEITDQLLPIPYNDLLSNPRLTQNMGY